MKRCRNTNLIFISIILLLSTFLFRNLIEPFDEISATQAAQILGDAAKAAHTASDQAAAAAVSAKASYDAAMSRFQSNPSQANGIALSNAEAQNTAAQQAAADAAVAAASADSAAAAAVESIPVSSPSPPTVPSELESAAMSAANPVEALSDSLKLMISIGCGIILLYILYSVLFSKRASNNS